MKKFILLPLVIVTATAMTACHDKNNDAMWDEPTNPTNPTNPTPIQTTSLTGKVVNKATNQPIANATIKVGNTTASTDTQGSYSITGLAIGSANITVSATSYTTQNITHNLQTSANAIDFSLQPESVTVPTNPTTSTGTSADCHNLAMEKVGSTWSTTTQELLAPQNQQKTDYVVVGETTFHGHPASDIQATVLNTAMGTIISHNFAKTVNGNFEQYGGYSNAPGSTEFYFDPAASAPVVREINKPIDVLFTVKSATTGDSTTSLTTTYLGKETITVPAGTFETCKTLTVTHDGYEKPWYNWVVASGQYRGIRIKEQSLNSDGSIYGGTQVTAMSTDFK